MEIIISDTKEQLGLNAAEQGAKLIHETIARNGKANIIVATGASQFEMLNELVKMDVDRSKVMNMIPASILQEHAKTWLFLDKGSATLL